MKEKTLQSSLWYTLGIVLYAIWINLGSALPDPMLRLKAPYTPVIMVLTAVLLLFYLCYLAFINQYVRYAWLGFQSWPVYLRFSAYLTLTAGVLCLVHIALMYAMLSQRVGGAALFVRYFRIDFWVFCLPLVLYCALLYRFPQIALFGFSKVAQLQQGNDALRQRKLYLRKKNALLQWELRDLDNKKSSLEQQMANIHADNLLLMQKEQESHLRMEELMGQRQGLLNALSDLEEQKRRILLEQHDLLDKQHKFKADLETLRRNMEAVEAGARDSLIAWREERRMSSLLTYIRALDQRSSRDASKEMLLHDLLFCYRKNRCDFVIDKLGRKQIVTDHVGDMLKDSPWFVQINGQIYFNMLYCMGQLEKYGAEKNRKKIVLDSATRLLLEQLLPQDELDEILESSRRCRKNFYCFWDSNNLRELNESGLFLEFRTDLERHKS
ncbi:hypothetical protein [Sphingobacterium sp.]|uniref:hypothetical protein n=1 Tax=Sphingobacterium sp. TaxID=341027 RepID=UPI0031E3F1E6